MMELHICNQDGALLKAYALGDSEEVIVGRDPSCDIRIQAPTVSREHCSIERQEEGLVVRDLGSTRGTIVAGNRVEQVRVTDGLEIVVGPAVLKFHESVI